MQRNPASATRTNDGRLPIDPPFLTVLRELTSQHRVLLIFDEVVTVSGSHLAVPRPNTASPPI